MPLAQVIINNLMCFIAFRNHLLVDNRSIHKNWIHQHGVSRNAFVLWWEAIMRQTRLGKELPLNFSDPSY